MRATVEAAVRDSDIVSEAVTGLVGSENYPTSTATGSSPARS